MELVEFGEAEYVTPESTTARIAVVIGAIVGIHLGAVIVLIAVIAGVVELLRGMFGPSLEAFARAVGLG